MEAKPIVEYYISEIKAESASSRKCLERIPEAVYKFKPHPKSMEMGYLTLLVAEIPRWIKSMIEDTVIDFVSYGHFTLSTTAALLAHYEENLKGALNALENSTPEQLNKEFKLQNDGKLLYSTPLLTGIGETINHWVHHRGQLTVYMRLNDIEVPSIYGPSADDPSF